jgi:hypothetical protein
MAKYQLTVDIDIISKRNGSLQRRRQLWPTSWLHEVSASDIEIHKLVELPLGELIF